MTVLQGLGLLLGGAALAWGVARLAWGGSGRPVLLALVVVVATHLARLGYHVDDAGIVYAQARHLAAGEGLIAQAGGPPLEAVSDPLWLAVVTGLSVLPLPVGLLVEVVELGLALAAIGLAVRLARASTPDEAYPHGGAVALAVATSGAWLAWSTAGLEGGLFGVLLLGLGLAAVRGATPGVLLLAFLTAWVRPEGALAALAVAGAGGWIGGAPGRRLAEAVVGAGLGVAALLGVRQAWLGTWIPHSAWVKGGSTSGAGLLAGLRYAVLAGVLTGGPLLALGALGRGPHRRVGAALAVLGMGLALAVASGGDWMRHARYVAPYVPVALAWAVPVLAGARDRRAPPLALLALGLLGAVVGLDALARPTVPLTHGLRRGGLYAAVGAEACGRTTVATPDVGGVLHGWPEVHVHDLAGLVDPEGGPGAPSWAERLDGVRPAVVDLHGGWGGSTGLDDATLRSLDYRVLCRRGGEATSPTLWVDDRCEGTLTQATRHAVDVFCARGSGAPWPGEQPWHTAVAQPSR